MIVPKNTAGSVFTFAFLDASGVAVTTGTPTRRVTLDGGSQITASPGTFTHEGGGQWSYVCTAADTNGTFGGFLFELSGALPVDFPFQTYTAFLELVRDYTTSGSHGVVGSSPTTTSIPLTGLQASTAGFSAQYIEFTSGALKGIVKPISGYTVGSSTTGTVTLSSGNALSAAPTAGDGVRLLGHHA